MAASGKRPIGWWRRARRGAARGWQVTRAHAHAEWRLLPNRYGPWRRVIRDRAVFAERRRRDGTVADVLPWSAYCAARARHRKLVASAGSAVRRNRWRWLGRALVGWL